MSLLSSMITACASPNLQPIKMVPKVDLPKFMGDWYVIAAIPTMIETESYNAVESYKQQLEKEKFKYTTLKKHAEEKLDQ